MESYCIYPFRIVHWIKFSLDIELYFRTQIHEIKCFILMFIRLYNKHWHFSILNPDIWMAIIQKWICNCSEHILHLDLMELNFVVSLSYRKTSRMSETTKMDRWTHIHICFWVSITMLWFLLILVHWRNMLYLENMHWIIYFMHTWTKLWFEVKFKTSIYLKSNCFNFQEMNTNEMYKYLRKTKMNRWTVQWYLKNMCDKLYMVFRFFITINRQ